MDRKTPSLSNDNAGIEYEITIKGHLEAHWADWMGGLNITHDTEGYSLLTGFIPDQAALHGILAQLRDLGLTLISIVPVDTDDENRRYHENIQ